jgi:glucokinase
MCQRVLAADVGGTKTDIAIYSSATGIRAPIARGTFQNRDFASVEDLVFQFLARAGESVSAACVDVAGPVLDGEASVTNLPWVLTEAGLKDVLQLTTVRVVNDLEATAVAVPLLQPSDLRTLSLGRRRIGGPVAVIAAGTGLGEAYLTWDGGRYLAHASEGGHTDFGPTTRQELELLEYLQARFEHVSYELVCSGLGIQHVYAFLKNLKLRAESPEVAARLAGAVDKTPVIVEAGLDRTHGSIICAATLNLFVSILAAECGNVALKFMATGGVYLGGGLPPRLLPLLEQSHFMQRFVAKGRLSQVLEDVPVQVIVSPAALMGAAHIALALLDGSPRLSMDGQRGCQIQAVDGQQQQGGDEVAHGIPGAQVGDDGAKQQTGQTDSGGDAQRGPDETGEHAGGSRELSHADQLVALPGDVEMRG